MNEIIMQFVIDRRVVLNAPETAEISLALLVAADKGFHLVDDVLWIGYPYEEEVGYRIVGFDPIQFSFHLEKIGKRTTEGCP